MRRRVRAPDARRAACARHRDGERQHHQKREVRLRAEHRRAARHPRRGGGRHRRRAGRCFCSRSFPKATAARAGRDPRLSRAHPDHGQGSPTRRTFSTSTSASRRTATRRAPGSCSTTRTSCASKRTARSCSTSTAARRRPRTGCATGAAYPSPGSSISSKAPRSRTSRVPCGGRSNTTRASPRRAFPEAGAQISARCCSTPTATT